MQIPKQKLVHEVWAVQNLLIDFGFKPTELDVQMAKHAHSETANLVCVVVSAQNKRIPINCGALDGVTKEEWIATFKDWIESIAKPGGDEQLLRALFQATDAFKERSTLHKYLRSCGLHLLDIQ